MARRSNHPGDDWMDALKAAMQVDPELRRQREDRDERDRRESRERPTLASAVAERKVEPAGPVGAGDDTVEAGDDTPVVPGVEPVAATPRVAVPPVKGAAIKGEAIRGEAVKGEPAQLPPAEFPWEKPEADPPAPLRLNFREPTPAVEASTVRPPMPVFGKRPGPTAAAIRLWGAVEPLMLFICRLNRMKRTGVLSDKFRPDSVRLELTSLLDAVADSGDAGADLVQPLRAFVDVVVTRAGFPFARRWPSLTQSTLPPEQVFQSAVSAAAADETRRLDGTWAVYHACLCLSADLLPATDSLRSGVELLEELDANLFTKPTERTERVCPQAYTGVYDQPLLPSVGKRLRAVAVASVAVLLIAIAVAVGLNVFYLKQTGQAIGAVKASLARPADENGVRGIENPMTKSQNPVKAQ